MESISNTWTKESGLAYLPYPGVSRGTPLLQKFSFNWHQGAAHDEKLKYITVLPSGDAVDLTPFADPSVGTVDPTQIEEHVRVAYFDQDKKPEHAGEVGHLVANGLTRYRVRGILGKGTWLFKLPPPPDLQMRFVLIGFSLYFLPGAGDRQIDEIGIWENNLDLFISFNDQDNKDEFQYVVDYAWVPSSWVASSDHDFRHMWWNSSEKVDIVDRYPPLLYPKVISGFWFRYARGDHNIGKIGALLQGKRLEVFFGDQSQDDPFNWYIDWTTLKGMADLGVNSNTLRYF